VLVWLCGVLCMYVVCTSLSVFLYLFQVNKNVRDVRDALDMGYA
jgi:hypothetical protein